MTEGRLVLVCLEEVEGDVISVISDNYPYLSGHWPSTQHTQHYRLY